MQAGDKMGISITITVFKPILDKNRLNIDKYAKVCYYISIKISEIFNKH